MKIPKLTVTVAVLLALAGCSRPEPFEIGDVCAQPAGTKVILRGYISLPRQMEIIRYTRGSASAGTSYKLFLMTKADASGDSIPAVFWGTSAAERNKIKMFPGKFTWNDLLVYTDDGQSVGAGKMVKVTGTTEADEKNKCLVKVSKIENP